MDVSSSAGELRWTPLPQQGIRPRLIKNAASSALWLQSVWSAAAVMLNVVFQGGGGDDDREEKGNETFSSAERKLSVCEDEKWAQLLSHIKHEIFKFSLAN